MGGARDDFVFERLHRWAVKQHLQDTLTTQTTLTPNYFWPVQGAGQKGGEIKGQKYFIQQKWLCKHMVKDEADLRQLPSKCHRKSWRMPEEK